MEDMLLRSNEYRVGLIGCGRIGADSGPNNLGSSRIFSHAKAYSEHPRTNLIAAYDLDVSALRRCGERWQISSLYSNLKEMLSQEHLDIVSISTPADSHLSIMREVLLQGSVQGILLEKPIALTDNEAEEMLGIVKGRQVKISVNYIRRFPPVYRKAADAIKGGELGQIKHIQVYYTKGVMNNASHAFDLLRFMFGDPEELAVVGSPLDTSALDQSLNLQLKFFGGLEACFSALDHRDHNIFEIDIVGSEGRFIFRDQGHILESYQVADTRIQYGFRQLEKTPHSQSTELSNAIYYAVDDLVDSIEKDINPVCTLEDGKAALALSLKALEKANLTIDN